MEGFVLPVPRFRRSSPQRCAGEFRGPRRILRCVLPALSGNVECCVLGIRFDAGAMETCRSEGPHVRAVFRPCHDESRRHRPARFRRGDMVGQGTVRHRQCPRRRLAGRGDRGWAGAHSGIRLDHGLVVETPLDLVKHMRPWI